MTAPTARQEAVASLLRFAGCLVAAWFALQLVRIAVFKQFTVDEFTYMHAGWLVSKGAVPSRDFNFITPAFAFLVSIPAALSGPGASFLLAARSFMLIFVFLIAAGLIFLNRPVDWAAGAAAVGFMAALPPLVLRIVEVRPDVAAFTLSIVSLCLLYRRSRAFAFASGVLLGIAFFTSVKVMFYGAGFGIAFLLDEIYNRPRGRPAILAAPGTFVIGFLVPWLALALYWQATGGFTNGYMDTFGVIPLHERYSRHFSWSDNYIPFFAGWNYLIALAAVGFVKSVRRLDAQGLLWETPEFILISLLPLSFFSYMVQAQPNPYSLTAFGCLVCLFAGRGLIEALSWALRIRASVFRWAVVLLVAMAVGDRLAASNDELTDRALFGLNNARQQWVENGIDEAAGAATPVYDNFGGGLTHPNPYWIMFTDRLMRDNWSQEIATRIPAAIEQSGTVVWLFDRIYDNLPPPLTDYLESHFVPYTSDIRLWGRRFQAGRDERFLAIRAGLHCVSPAAALKSGRLLIDGRAVTTVSFPLDAGWHRVRWDGPKDAAYFILWEPKTGPYDPLQGQNVNPLFYRTADSFR